MTLLAGLFGWKIAAVASAGSGEALSWGDRIRAGLTAVSQIVGEVWLYVLLGIAVGPGIHGQVPENFMASIMGADAWWSVPLAVVLGVPMSSNAAPTNRVPAPFTPDTFNPGACVRHRKGGGSMQFVLGLVVGMLVTGLAAWFAMPRLMLKTTQSRMPVDETVDHIVAAAQAEGWQVPKVYDLHLSLAKAGFPLGRQVRVISLCKPAYAREVLGRGQFRKLAGIMPCRIGVYEGEDGGVHIAQMNTGLMGRMFGSFVGEIMGKVSEEEHRFLASVIA